MIVDAGLIKPSGLVDLTSAIINPFAALPAL
jgi:hypothetical protein